ncbi:MAG: hypothetical protein K8953_09575, partial [Proteobacteria bacterium]|nr:hypothetical protein [Pseudomonadota bacterium]
FVLHINFGAGDQAGTITGQAIAKKYGVRALNGPDYRYRLDGEFDDSGVIKGTSQFGNFKNRDTETPQYGQNPGTLTGLIGEEGAIGVFISNTGGYTGYAGGFIATPSLQNYVSSADLDDYYHLTWPTDPLYRNETSSFLAVSSTGEMNTGTLLTREGNTPTVETLTLANATYQGRALGGDATDGIAFFKGWKGPTDTLRSTKIHYRVYSGIFDDINLGAPVTETSGKAYWKGQFKSVHFDRVVSKDFTLEVSFSNRVRTAGRVDALVHDTGLKHFKVSASFNHRGVIDGRVIFGDYENNNRSAPHTSYRYADLVGLIGQEGAVAMFKRSVPPPSSSGRSPSLDFAGGFVAVPNLPPVVDTTPNRVTTADWVASFGTAGLSAPADINTPGDRFVRASATGLDRQTFVEAGHGPILVSLNLADATFGGSKLGGDAADGVVIFKGTNKFVGKDSNGWIWLSYAGILENTDLGAPLSEPNGTTAIWHGHIRVNSAWNEKLNKDFALHVNFGAGDQAGEIRAFIKKEFAHGDRVSPLAIYRLNGSFDDNGLIEGTFRENFTESFGESEYPAVLKGLIGEEGAVGVIISEHTGIYGYVGGFVARPGLNDRVTASDWEDRFQYPQLYKNPIQWQKSDGFLRPSSTGINTAHFKKRDGTAPDIITLNLRDATFNNVALGGDVADGVAFFKGWNGNGMHP